MGFNGRATALHRSLIYICHLNVATLEDGHIDMGFLLLGQIKDGDATVTAYCAISRYWLLSQPPCPICNGIVTTACQIEREGRKSCVYCTSYCYHHSIVNILWLSIAIAVAYR